MTGFSKDLARMHPGDTEDKEEKKQELVDSRAISSNPKRGMSWCAGSWTVAGLQLSWTGNPGQSLTSMLEESARGMSGSSVEACLKILGYVVKLICIPTNRHREKMVGEEVEIKPSWVLPRPITEDVNSSEAHLHKHNRARGHKDKQGHRSRALEGQPPCLGLSQGCTSVVSIIVAIRRSSLDHLELWVLLLRGCRDSISWLSSGFLGGRTEGRMREDQLDSAHRLEGLLYACGDSDWSDCSCVISIRISKAWSGEQVMLAIRF